MSQYFVADSADDLVRFSLEELIARGRRISPRKGEALELQGISLELRNPLARLSRTESRGKIFSALGELCWYLAGSDSSSFISYYLKKYEESAVDGVVPGAYGPRLMGASYPARQLSTVTELLRRHPESRRAVVQLFDAADLVDDPVDVPCTCVLQFMVRSDELQMIVYMRSNDIMFGLTHDIFAFTMIQELLCRSLNVGLGSYIHIVGSLHLYEDASELAVEFLEEGWQSTHDVMPPMPIGDPWESIQSLLIAEEALRLGRESTEDLTALDAYWQDLVRLLEIFKRSKAKDPTGIQSIRAEMKSDAYRSYIDERLRSLVS